MSLERLETRTRSNPVSRVLDILEKLEDEITAYNSALYSALSHSPLFGRGKRRAKLKQVIRSTVQALLGPEYARAIRKISKKEGERAFRLGNNVYRYRITGVDAIEALVFFKLATSPETRAALIDATIEWLRDAKIVYKGEVMDVEEYVKRVEGVTWTEFEETIRGKMERAIVSLANDFTRVEGDVSAYYAWTRDRVIREGRLEYAWLAVLHRQYMTIVSRPVARVAALEDAPLLVADRKHAASTTREKATV